ncbi:hypothetical protein [Amycolatopsis magusensis]|uniref:hypothetical protein n=1 Tax=Amycolatopsis magusensis TaxID=882444 RepID=UPI0037BD2BA0
MKRVAMGVCAATLGLGALLGTAGTASAQFDFEDKRSPEEKCHSADGIYVSTKGGTSLCKFGKPQPTSAEKCQEGNGAVHNRPDGYKECIGGQYDGNNINAVSSAPDDDQQGLVPFLVTTLVGS